MEIKSSIVFTCNSKIEKIITIHNGSNIDIEIGKNIADSKIQNIEELTQIDILNTEEHNTENDEKELTDEILVETIDHGATGFIVDSKTPRQITFFAKNSTDTILSKVFTFTEIVEFYSNKETRDSVIFIPHVSHNKSTSSGSQFISLRRGDCRELLEKIPSNSIDSIVTDPPYEIGFGAKKWDSSGIAYDPKVWAEAYRVLKPGGYLLSFGATRMWHRVAVAIEDTGFEIKDNIAWMYGTGFPKNMNIPLAMEKYFEKNPHENEVAIQEQWESYGTAIKPAFEPIIMARKPIEGTIIKNLIEHGTGALHIDAARIPTTDKLGGGSEKNGIVAHQEWSRPWMKDPEAVERSAARTRAKKEKSESLGRFPSNVILDESQAEALDRQISGDSYDPENPKNNSRFFYIAKVSRKENPEINGKRHSTVKPIELMKQLVKLVTPTNGVVLDPFAGSGSTLAAAHELGLSAIGLELDPDNFHIPLIKHRFAEIALPEDENMSPLF